MAHLRRHLIPRSQYTARNKDCVYASHRRRLRRRFIPLLNATVADGFNLPDKLRPEENVLRSFVVTE